MNGLLCLEWCLTYGHHFPADRRTAMHVRDWLADKAAEEATGPDELRAVQAARDGAKAVLEAA